MYIGRYQRTFTFYVYILTNKSKSSLYVGVTNDLRRRVYEHRNGIRGGFTKQYRITQLVYYEVYQYVWNALQREKTLKRWNRQWKEDLIATKNPEWKDLWNDIIL